MLPRGASTFAILDGFSCLAARIESLVIRVAQEFNDVRATAGNLASLSTVDKSSLVAAINELKAAVLTATAIDDAQVATTTTYSSNKIVALLDALKADILGGADAAYDTLVEIQQLLQNGTTGLDAILSATRDENGHYSLAVRGLQRPLKVSRAFGHLFRPM